jgi:EpsI family protein
MRHARLATALLLVAAAAAIAQTARLRAAPPPIALESVPLAVEGWRGRNAGALDAETIRILAADSYLNRAYEGGGMPIGLYIAYYARQRPGVSIHSPLHCLPGTGWEPLDVSTRSVSGADGSSGDLRRMLVRKGRERAVVLYWYAVHGRVIGNEIVSKAWLLRDSVLFNRSDAALVRIVVPVSASVESAEADGLAFARALLPRIASLWS